MDEQTLDTARTRFTQVKGRSFTGSLSSAAGYSQMEAGAAAQSKALTNIEQLQERSQKAASLLQAQAASMEARFKAIATEWSSSASSRSP